MAETASDVAQLLAKVGGLMTHDWLRFSFCPLTSYLQPEVEFLQRSSYFRRQTVHALALLESDDHVRSPFFHRDFRHDFLHAERIRQSTDDIVQYRLDLRTTRGAGTFRKWYGSRSRRRGK